MTIPEHSRRALCDTHATLDNQPALITGSMMPFAMVRSLTSSLSAEFAWETVAHIVADRAGSFKS